MNKKPLKDNIDSDSEWLKLVDKLEIENKWLKEEVRKRFSSGENQTIAYMLGKTQLDFVKGELSLREIPLELLSIYTQYLQRQKRKSTLTLFQKLLILVDEHKTQNLLSVYHSDTDLKSQSSLDSMKVESKLHVENNDAISQKIVSNSEQGGVPNQKNNDGIKLSYRNKRDKSIANMCDIRISAIMDEFTYKSYKEECDIDLLSVDYWQEQLEAFNPDFLFVESAWRGRDDGWDRKISTLSTELQGVIEWCKFRNIPTVFWNKEDPVHFQTFINTAKKFDFVFTTDIDCIIRYKKALNHENIYWLPFAAQLKFHNPIEKYDREDAFCFAGAYYVKYPERTRDLNAFVDDLSQYKPFIIYDRNYHNNDDNYKFPEKFTPFIKGNLPYEQIDKAYKGYNYSINLNSIKQSQGMFARRVFEVLASNTILVSNYSRAVRLLLGDLVASSDSSYQILKQLNDILESPYALDKTKLYALRKVLSEHTYTHRLKYLTSKVLKTNFEENASVLILCSPKNNKELEQVTQSFNSQLYPNKKLLVMGQLGAANYNLDDVQKFLSNHPEYNFVSYFSAKDYYGEYYLTDLVLAMSFTSTDIVGKSKHYRLNNMTNIELVVGETYKYSQLMNNTRCLIKAKYFSELVEKTVVDDNNIADITFRENTLSTDYFNYCEDFYTYPCKKLPIELENNSHINSGLSFNKYFELEKATISSDVITDSQELTATYLARHFTKPKNKPFDLELVDRGLKVTSNLESNKHDYYYIAKPIALSELGIQNDQIQKIYFDIEPGLNLQLVFRYLDKEHKNIGHVIIQAMKNDLLSIPEECEYLLLGLRLYGPGETIINTILFDHKIIDPAYVVSDKDYLLITNHYPSYDDLYKNAFVHSRVKAYKEHDVLVDVFKLRRNEKVSYYEFEGVDVTIGSNDALEKMIIHNHFKTIMVHFLDISMWDTLKKFVNTHKIIVWVHGAEIQAWHRRSFNYENDAQANKARELYESRAKFWREIINEMPKNLHFVFVSNYFADEVMSDLGVKIPRGQYSIIHNPIDTEHFKYQEKSAEMRKKILSIRPYASRTYANDLTVKAILELSKEKFFDELEFRLIGDGVLFEETLAPLRKFNNVIIEKKFLTHDEIASLHKEYGIFLCPSRMDTQGVSRDEAMSSGLVPVTNAVGAIPEFLQDFEQLLARAGSGSDLAKIIKKLYLNPNFYMKSSQSISQNLSNREKSYVINEEINLIK